PSMGRRGPALDRFVNVSHLLGTPRVIADAGAGDIPSLPRGSSVLRLPGDLADTGMQVEHASSPDDIALIQFSSGSTGTPKGVVLTHRNVTANLAAIQAGIGATPDDVGVSWMPLTHDLGLVGFLLGSAFVPNDVVLIETSAFARRPLL